MLDNKEFDLWANEYDKSVGLSEEENSYPFVGYKDILNTIYNIIHTKERAKILDIGFGTGVLTKKLYDDKYFIYGIDFSEKMIEIAKEKILFANLYKYDFSKGLPKELNNIKFDYIISTYAIHHLKDKEKINFLTELLGYLSNDGEIIIGDVAFKTREELEKCKINCGYSWDNDEVYIVFDELKRNFSKEKICFLPISYCSGILRLKK